MHISHIFLWSSLVATVGLLLETVSLLLRIKIGAKFESRSDVRQTADANLQKRAQPLGSVSVTSAWQGRLFRDQSLSLHTYPGTRHITWCLADLRPLSPVSPVPRALFTKPEVCLWRHKHDLERGKITVNNDGDSLNRREWRHWRT